MSSATLIVAYPRGERERGFPIIAVSRDCLEPREIRGLVVEELPRDEALAGFDRWEPQQPAAQDAAKGGE